MAPPCFFFRSLLLAACLAVTLPPPACSGPAGPTFSPAGCLDPPTGVATFRPMVEELEGREGPPHFTGLPRGVQQRTYSGTDLWNSRGMNLTQAVRAMLGDPFAYYETALFTVYKMALLNQTAALPYLVYTWDRGHWPTTEDGPWPQYKYFKELVRDIVPALADSGLADVGAGLSEAAAVCRARLLLDHRFARLGREDLDRTYLLGVENDLGEDPYDCLYSSCYQGLTNEVYGPDVVVLAPDHRKRGLDLNFYQDRFCPHSHDYSEILTPGYRFPDAIEGYLVLTWNIRSEDEDQFKGVEWAFFKAHHDGADFVLLLGTQELDHPVFCVDQHPAGHFVECIPDSIQKFTERCRENPQLPPHRLTNVTIPVIGVLYQGLSEDEPAIPGGFVAGQNAERRARAQAVLARERGDGVMCNATLKKPLRPDVRALVEGALSTDGSTFEVALWTVDMVQYPAAPSNPTAAVGSLTAAGASEVRKLSREPPLWIIALLCLGSVGGDLLGQRATRHHFKSTRRMILVSMLVSALLVLVLGGLGELLFPRQTGRIVVRGRPVQCYREMLAGVPGKDEAFCTTRPGQCSPVGCPAQGPSTIGWAIGAHPLLLLLGLLAILYHVCEVVLHLHPLGILFKPLASFFATFLIVPLARVFGYWEAPIPAYVMLVGAAGTYLCLYEKKRAPAPHQHVELATVDDATPEEDARARKAPRPLGAGAVVGTATVEDDFPVSEHFHENTGQGWVLGGAKEKAGYVAVDAEEVEKHVLQQDGDEAARLLGGAGKGDGAGRSLVGFLLLGAIFGVLVTSMAVWVIVQKLVNDRCRVNEFGFTALDQVLLPLYMGVFLWVCDWLPAGYRQVFLPDMHDQEQTLAQAARQAVAQCCAARAEALALVVVQRALANARIAVFFWLSIKYNLTSVFFESTVLRISMSWLVVLAVNTLAPSFINLADTERFTFRDADTRRVILIKGLGTVVVFFTLVLLELRR